MLKLGGIGHVMRCCISDSAKGSYTLRFLSILGEHSSGSSISACYRQMTCTVAGVSTDSVHGEVEVHFWYGRCWKFGVYVRRDCCIALVDKRRSQRLLRPHICIAHSMYTTEVIALKGDVECPSDNTIASTT